MKITASSSLSNLESVEELRRFVGAFSDNVASALNSRLTFSDNFLASIITFVFTGANTTLGMPHKIGVIPSGYILVGTTVAMSLYDGEQANSTDTLFLRSTAAGTAKVLVFG